MLFKFNNSACSYAQALLMSILDCVIMTQLFKSVAERGKWSYMFMEAMQLYDEGDVESSLMMYTLLAELGMEVAQSNAAFLLEQGLLMD